jgi:hypothetical protein
MTGILSPAVPAGFEMAPNYGEESRDPKRCYLQFWCASRGGRTAAWPFRTLGTITNVTNCLRQAADAFEQLLQRGEVARHRRLDPWNRQRAERPQQNRRRFQLDDVGELGPVGDRVEQVAGRGLEGADLPLDG